MGTVRCTFQRGCKSESGISSSSISTCRKVIVSFRVVSGGAVVATHFRANGSPPVTFRSHASRLMPATGMRSNNMYSLSFISAAWKPYAFPYFICFNASFTTCSTGKSGASLNIAVTIFAEGAGENPNIVSAPTASSFTAEFTFGAPGCLLT